MPHEHRWIVFSTDVRAQTATLYCRCGAVDETQGLDPGALAALLDPAPDPWRGQAKTAEVTP